MPEICPIETIQDIEDVINAQTELRGPSFRNEVVARVVRNKPKEAVFGDSFLPGTHAVYVKTWGCAHNSSDSEYMAGQLAASGYTIVDDAKKADLWLLNSCTVKNPAEDHFRHEIEQGHKEGKKVVVAGCVSQATPHVNYLKGLSIIGVQQTDRVVEVVEETLKGNSVRLLGTKKSGKRKAGGADLTLPKIRRNPLIEIIAINTGCLNHCTYCKTKHARGDLGSYPIPELVDRARQAFQEGVREIWLTSEDTGAYGRDIGVTLPDLLREMVTVIPQGCMLRLGMTNPPYILDHLEEMAEILSHPRVYSFLHIPVQSGSDPVLSEMKRVYTVAEFRHVVDYLRQRVPGITIATDIICGFPTETEEDFDNTMKLVDEYRFPSLFINQFYPRPGTIAASMKRIPTHAVKARTKRLTELFQSYRPYDHKIGEAQTVLVTEVAHDRKHLVGHNKYYEQVLLPPEDDFMGSAVDVRISGAGKHYMHCEVIRLADSMDAALPRPLPPGQVSGVKEEAPAKANGASCRNYSASVCAERWMLVIAVAVLALLVKFALQTDKGGLFMYSCCGN
uniref:tRNA-t(6)A37 methylthiotransferase n=1 Tax=Ornithodoros turicata TaxID=34597 RepID=A0A2R5LJW5_9ACAR